MSASAITDALITMYGAASAFGSDCGRTYKVMETTSGSCMVVSWTGLNDSHVTFGGGAATEIWTFGLEVFVKDSGGPTADMGRSVQVADTVLGVVRADRTIQGTTDHFVSLTGDRNLPPENFVEAGGHIWHRHNFFLTVEEYVG